MTEWTLFHQRPALARAPDALDLILHGGALAGHDTLRSDPSPYCKWRNSELTIEIAAHDLAEIASDDLVRIDKVWIHDHGRKIRSLPQLLWTLPSLRELSLTDSRLNTSLFQRGLPHGLRYLRLTGSGRLVPKGPPNPGLLYLDTFTREFHPRLSPQMFPNLQGLSVHVGRKSDKKDRREMWEVIRSFPKLTALHVGPADHALDWSALPSGLRRLTVDGGDLNDLKRLGSFEQLDYLNLRFLKSLRSLDGVERFKGLKTVVMTGMERVEDFSALDQLHGLERVQATRTLAPALFADLEARGVTIRG